MQLKRLPAFLTITYLFTWTFWIALIVLVRRGALIVGEWNYTLLFTIGGFGPFVGAITVLPGEKSLKRIFDRIFFSRDGSWIWLFAMALALFITVGASSLELAMGMTLSSAPYLLLVSTFFQGGQEEIGWRGTLQPILEERFSYPISTLITGLIWACWHLPLWLIPGTGQSEMPFLLYAFLAVLLSFWLGGLYKKTGSVFYCSLFHGWNNLLFMFFVIKPNLLFFIGLILMTVFSSRLAISASRFD